MHNFFLPKFNIYDLIIAKYILTSRTYNNIILITTFVL
nr:MAG TPA: hypothetical protein [Caudoviricetes sp.]